MARLTNEKDSADAYRAYKGRGRSKRYVDEVCRLIELTAGHKVLPADRRGAIMVSIDLAILGSDPETYARYAANIRREYKEVPEERYRVGRAAVMRRFLDAPRIYPNDRAHDLWEAKARENIARELETLTA
jgi:predicted metal-dependent HD superfamily phosphohydrolase